MQREEPTARLVNALGDEVGGIDNALVQRFLVLEGIVNLCVRHRAAVEPHVDEVQLALQRLSALAHEDDVIHVGTVQVDTVVVLLAHVARHEALVLERVVGHHARAHALFYFVVEFLDAADADLLARLAVAPDGQRRAPVAAAAEVPVVEVLQPFAEAPRARRFGLPQDGLVQLHHALLGDCRTDEPAVEGIVEHRLVSAPAVRVVVYVLLNLESRTLLLHLHAQDDVQVLGLGQRFLVQVRILRVVGVLHEVTGVVPVAVVDAGLHESLVHVVLHEVLTREIHHGARVAGLVDDEQRGDAGILGHLGIVGTEGRCDVYDTRTVLRGHIVTGDDAECLGALIHGLAVLQCARLHPGEELLVVQTHEVRAHELAHHFGSEGALLLRLGEIDILAALGHNVDGLLLRIRILPLHRYILDLRTYAQRRVRRQRPGRRRPSEDIDRQSPTPCPSPVREGGK